MPLSGECQYITGGNANIIMVFASDDVRFLRDRLKEFTRSDLEAPVTRLFSPTCGTAIGTRMPRRPSSIILKVGTVDDPSIFVAQAAIFTVDIQPFHTIPSGVSSFERLPG